MSSVVESVSGSRLVTRSAVAFDLLFGILPLLFLTPLLGMEFQSLWHRKAMSFFPVPILIVACFALWHLQSPRSNQPQRVLLARGFFLIGVGVFGAAVWKFSPLLAHCSFVLVFVGWAIERLGTVAWPRVIAWAALLATSMRLPGDLNTRLHEWLVHRSSATTGCILDGLSIPNLIRADTFSIRGLEFSLNECCTSVFSIHALASVVTLVLILSHRSLLVAILSLLSVPLWAIVQQVLLLLAIVLLKHFGERDASQGLDLALLETASFVIVAGCCWATSWFLAKILLPVPAADSEFELEFLILNSVACWPQPDPFAGPKPPNPSSENAARRSVTASQFAQRASLVGVVCLVALGFFSTHQVVYGRIAEDSTLPPIDMKKVASTEWNKLFPETFERWRRLEATHQIQRIDGIDRAVITWQFGWQGQIIQLSLGMPFKSHPSLAAIYEAQGWRVVSEQAKQYTFSPQKPDGGPAMNESQPTSDAVHTWTELVISNELGGQALALVGYAPLQKQASATEPPIPSLAGSEYQVILFCESGEALTAPQLAELYGGFQKANEYLRTEIEPRLLEMVVGTR